MAISYVASATSDYTATTPAAQAVPMPPGWQQGDLLLLFIPQGVVTNSTTVTWTGATEVGNSLGGSDQFTSLWWKIASASESPTYSTSDASSRSSSVMVAYRGVDPSTPIDVAVGFVDSPAGTSHTVPSQTVTAGAWLVSLASLDGSAGTATPQYTEPSGWTKRLDYLNNTTDNYASGLADLGPLSAGTQSGHVWTSVYADRAVNVTVVALRNYVPPSVNGYILMESGDRVLSESGSDLVVSEDYSPSVAASGTGALSLSGTGGAGGGVDATGALSLSGASAATAAADASAALSLSGAASATVVLPAASGALTLSGTASGGGTSAATGSGALSLSGTAGAQGGAPATGALALAGTAGATGVGSGSGALSLSGAAGASGALTATGSLSLSGTAAAPGGAVYIGATSVGQTGTASTSSPSAAMPSGTQGGDLLVAFHGIGSSSDTVTFPAGWSTPVRETGATGVGDSFSWKVAAGTVGQATTEPALVVSSGTNRNHVLILLAFRVSDTSNPIVLAAHSPITPASTSKATPGGTASGDILELNAVFDHPAGSTSSDSTWTPPSGVTVRGEANNVQNGSFGSSAVVATNDTNPTSTGSMPTRTWTTTLNVVGSAWSVALKSGGSPSAPTPTITYRVNGLARVRTKTANATSVRLKIGTDSGVTAGIQYTSPVTPDGEGLALHNWSSLGLTAGQRYYYRVMMTDSLSAEIEDTESTTGTFKVAPTGQTSFNFCFAGCTQEGPDSASLAAVAARGDDFFLHLGDMYYADGSGTSVANFRAKIDEKLSVANHKAVFATMAMSYCASDHDGGMNNNYVGAGDATARDNFNSVHRERFPNPLVPATTGTYHTWTWGRVRFIHTDERSFKSLTADTDNSSKTMLGATQKQWFKDTITATTTEQVIVWVGDTPWTGTTTAGEDHWAGYNTERQELATFITTSGKNVARIGSDMHAVAADDGTNSAGGIPVFHGGPLNNNASIKGVYTHGPYPASGTAIVQQYGRIAVTDSGTSISLAFTGYSSDNTARVTYTKVFTTTPTSASGTASLTLSGTAGASGGTPAAGSLSLSGTASARGAAVASGSLSLSGTSGSQAAAPAASGSLSLSGAGAADGAATASGTLSLAGTGNATGSGAATGTGSLSLSGTGAARGAAAASGALSLAGTASAAGALVASGSLALSGSAAASGGASGAGSLSLSGAGAVAGAASGSGALSLSGTASGTGSTPASATGFITLFAQTVPALPGGAPAAGSISISGTSGARGVASATGSVSLSGTGTAATPASGTGSITLSGSANILTTPTAGGTLSLSGISTSSRGGSPANGALSLTGTAGASAPLWVVTGTVSLSGAASAHAVATAAGSLSLAGTANTTGSVPASGTGSLTLSGSAAARGAVSATGALSVSGGASISATPTGSGTLLISGTATGLTGGNVAPGSITLTGTAGARAAAGATGTLAVSGSAGVGTISPASGTGSLSLSGTASASGRASSATGTLAVSGTASARASVLPVGTLSLSGTAGARGVLPSATGSLSLLGTSAAKVVATATGSIEMNGYVILVPAPVLSNPVARLRPNTARGKIRPNGRGSLKRNAARGRIRT